MNIALMTHYYAGYGLNTMLCMEMSANGNMQTVYVWLRGAGRQYLLRGTLVFISHFPRNPGSKLCNHVTMFPGAGTASGTGRISR